MSSSRLPKVTGQKRKNQHVTRACNFCRSRKIRCDGLQPTCDNCRSARAECTYEIEKDGRRAIPKTVAEALQHRVLALESLLAARGISFSENELLDLIDHNPDGFINSGRLTPPGGRRLSWVHPMDAEEDEHARASDDVGPSDIGIDRLRLQDGELRQYGPSTCFPINTDSESPPVTRGGSAIPEVLCMDSSSLYGQTATSTTQVYSTSIPVWRRHLPEEVALSKEAHDEALDGFFRYYAAWCSLLDRSSFFTDMETCLRDNLVRRSHYSPLLHNAVLSLGLAYSDDPDLAANEYRKRFAAEAVKYINSEAERPLISTVLGLLALGNFFCSSGLSGLGYLYSGMALRSAQTLGLGIDCSAFVRRGLVTPEVKASRDLAFYACFVQDKLWSFHTGRSASLAMPSYEIILPKVDADADNQIWSVNEDTNETSSPSSGDPRSWVSSSFREMVKLAYIGERILKTIYSVHLNIRSAQVNSLVSEINVQLERWHSELPKPLRIIPQIKQPPLPHILMLHACYHYFIILLYRPICLFGSAPQTPASEAAMLRCMKAATRVGQILELYRVSPGLRFASDLLGQISYAGATIALSLSRDTGSGSGRRFADTSQTTATCREALLEIGYVWPLCALLSQQLNQIMQEGAGSPDEPGTAEPPLGVKQLLASRPDLFEELRRLGWTPPENNATQSTFLAAPQQSTSAWDAPMQISGVQTFATAPIAAQQDPLGYNFVQDVFQLSYPLEGQQQVTASDFDFLDDLLRNGQL